MGILIFLYLKLMLKIVQVKKKKKDGLLKMIKITMDGEK
jgi:hypothetical protein